MDLGWMWAGFAVLASLFALACLYVTVDILRSDDLHPAQALVAGPLFIVGTFAACYCWSAV